MLRYMLDSDICIYAIKRRPQGLAERLDEHSDEVGISSIVLGELIYGAEKSERCAANIKAIEAFASQLDVLPFDAGAAAHFGQIRADLVRAGQPIGGYDMLIAGHARALGAVLVTNNIREFTRVSGLRVENWAA